MTIIPLLLAAALSAGNAEFDATAAGGAMDIAIARETARLAAEGPAKGALKARMLANPSAYATTEQAKERAKADYRALAEAELEASRAQAAEKLGLTDLKSLKAVAVPNLDASFEKRFAEERQAACAEQAKTITANVKPNEKDFGHKLEETIRAELEGAVLGQQRAVVFEENKKYISEKIVEPILESARQELKRQREYLEQIHCDSYSPSAFEKELAAKLEESVAQRRAQDKDAAISWGAFPVVVQEGAKELAEKRMLERVANAIDDVEMKVDAEFLRGKIAADKVRHRKAADSERAFHDVFAGVLASKALDKVVAYAPEAERAEFRDFVMQHKGDASLGKAVEARVKRELVPEVARVRGEIAAEDAKKLWPALMDGTWFPEPSLADAMHARSDYTKAVGDWRNAPDLVKFAKAGEGTALIEETDRLADERVAKAFDLARNAINAQNAVLDQVMPEVLVEAKDRKSSWLSTTPDYGKIIGMLTAGVKAKWDETREGVLWGEDAKPANAGLQHRELFPSVKRRIELVAKTVLMEMEKPEPEETPEEEPEEMLPEDKLTIEVNRNGDRIEAKITRGEASLFSDSCPAGKGELRTMFNAFADALEKAMEAK